VFVIFERKGNRDRQPNQAQSGDREGSQHDLTFEREKDWRSLSGGVVGERVD